MKLKLQEIKSLFCPWQAHAHTHTYSYTHIKKNGAREIVQWSPALAALGEALGSVLRIYMTLQLAITLIQRDQTLSVASKGTRHWNGAHRNIQGKYH